MLNKILLLAPVIIVSGSMTACSGNRPQTTSVTTQQSKVYTQTNKQIAKSAPRATRVVYEKRKYRRPAAKPARRSYAQIPRSSFANKLSNAALSRLNSRVRYDGSYLKIGYPWGDVPANIGVCTDVVIRSYRKLGIDLQSQVHQDMKTAFNTYPNPKKWGLSKPDTNIDHRRVYNLRKFFTRKGAALPITRNPSDYRPGDLVTWMVGPALPHIGVVVNKRSRANPNRFMIVHNIARGPQIEDVLFRFPITGHYRYTAAHVRNKAPRTLYASNARTRIPKGMSRVDAMNYGLLEAASNQLGTSSRTNNIKSINANYQKMLKNGSPAAKNKQPKSIQLATLNDAAIRELLSK